MDTLNIMMEIVGNMFNRQTFTAHLLERSFTQVIGWVELALVVALLVGCHFAAGFLQHSIQVGRTWQPWLRHVLNRILWPVLVLLAGIVGLIGWRLFDLYAVWLRLLILGAYWMVLIRLVLAVLGAALPSSKWTYQLERITAMVLWVCFLLWVSGIDDMIIDWLKSLEFAIGKSKLNLYTILTGFVWVGIVMIGMLWLAKWINRQLMASERLDLNLRIVLSKLTTTVLIFLSVIIALPLVGIDLTVLSVFGGAFGVGLGFGLQKIASNYVSGFIILADRSIRPGDRLTVNNFTGYVTQITSRFVVLKSVGGQEALIPNETFVTSTVINESFTGKALYQSLDVQVAYHTDLTLALRILKEAAAAQERVDTESPPNSFLVNFGESGIDLRVGFWVKDPENGFAALFSAILLTIWQRFNEENIDFPFPQREIRILPEEEKPSQIAVKKAGLAAKRSDTRSNEPTEND